MTTIFRFLLFFFIATSAYASSSCTSGSTVACSFACLGDPTTCSSFSDDTSCFTQSGCDWRYDCTSFDEAGCIDTATCGGGEILTDCVGDPECSAWSADADQCTAGGYYSCQGGQFFVSCSGAGDCPSYTTEGECLGDGNCDPPTYDDCGNYGDEGSCTGANPACSWAGGGFSCTTVYVDCSTLGDVTSCTALGGCSWSGNDCTASYGDCVDFTGDQSSCEGTSGCSWDDPFCSGSYYTGCTGDLYPQFCFGDGNYPCSNWGEQAQCEADIGCSWFVGYCPSDKCVVPMDF